MPRILFIALAATGVFAFPTFAQVMPTATGAHAEGSAHAGVSSTGAPSNTGVGSGSTDTSAASDATGSSDLGLGGLLKQTQATESSGMDDAGAQTGSRDAKALAKKARAHGH
jgi:hypothetical protein